MRKIKKKDIAERLGVSQAAVSQWFSGVTRPNLSRAYALKDEFNIPLNAWRDIKAYLKK